MKLFELYAELGLDASGFDSGVTKASKKGNTLANSLKSGLVSATNAVGNGVKATTIMMGNLMASAVQKGASYVKDFVGIGLDYNSTMETYVTNFTTMLNGSSAAAQKLTGDLEDMAASTPFAMADLAGATQTLLSFGQESGTVLDTLQSLGDIAMGDANRLSSLTLAFAQASSSGKLMGQDLMQMINAGFNPLQTIVDKTGASMGELKDFMSNGKASAELKKQMKAAQKEVKQMGDAASDGAKLLAQMAEEGVISAETLGMIFEMETSPGGRYYNAMQNASQTFEGMLSTLKDDSAALLGKVFKPMSDYIKSDLMPKAQGFINNVNKGFEVGGIKGAWSAAVGTIGGYIDELGGKALDAGSTLLANILSGLIGDTVSSEQIKATLGGIFSAVGEAKDDVIDACKTFFSDVSAALGDPDATLTEKIGGVFTAANVAISDVLGAAGTFMMDLYASVSGDTEGAEKFSQYVSEVWSGAQAGLDNIIAVGSGLLGGIYKGLTEDGETRQNIIQFFIDMFGEVRDGAGEFGNMLKTVYTKLTGKEATPENIAQTAEDVGERAGQAAKGVGQVLTGEAKAVLRVPAVINDLIEIADDESLTIAEKETSKLLTFADSLAEPVGDMLGGIGEIVGAVAGWDSVQEFEDAVGLEHFGPGIHKVDFGYTEDPGILAEWQEAAEKNATVIKSQTDLMNMIGTMWASNAEFGLSESQLDNWLSIIQGGKKDAEYYDVAQQVMDAFEGTSGLEDISSAVDALSNAASELGATAAALPGATVSALNGAKVEMDGQTVGELVAPTVDAYIVRQYKTAGLTTA